MIHFENEWELGVTDTERIDNFVGETFESCAVFFRLSIEWGGKLFLFSRRILETCFFIGQRVAASFLLAKEYWRTVFLLARRHCRAVFIGQNAAGSYSVLFFWTEGKGNLSLLVGG